jgi:hypothetical protein
MPFWFLQRAKTKSNLTQIGTILFLENCSLGENVIFCQCVGFSITFAKMLRTRYCFRKIFAKIFTKIWTFCKNICFLNTVALFCPCCLVLANPVRPTYQDWPVLAVRPSCHVPAALSFLSWSKCPVPYVISWMPGLSCPVLPIPSGCSARCPFQAVHSSPY